MNKRALLLIIVVVFAVGVLVGGYFYFQNLKEEKNISSFVEEQISNKDYKFLLADTPEKRVQGLSSRDGLPGATVMLFDFEKEDGCVIWMKDMKFSIDIIWLDNNFKVIDFKESASPDTYPTVFSPISSCRYVIEANDGLINENALKIGDKVSVDFNNSTLKITKNLQQP